MTIENLPPGLPYGRTKPVRHHRAPPDSHSPFKFLFAPPFSYLIRLVVGSSSASMASASAGAALAPSAEEDGPTLAGNVSSGCEGGRGTGFFLRGGIDA